MVNLRVAKLGVTGYLAEDQYVSAAARAYRSRRPDGLDEPGESRDTVHRRRPGDIYRPGCGVIESRMVDLRMVQAIEEAVFHHHNGHSALAEFAGDRPAPPVNAVPDKRHVRERREDRPVANRCRRHVATKVPQPSGDRTDW